MKRLLSIIVIAFCASILSFGQGVSDRPIDGYFFFNGYRTVDFFMMDDRRVDETETGVKAGVPFMIFITKPTSGQISWQTLSGVPGTYIVSTGNNGHEISFHTDTINGTLVLLGTDSSGNQITITVYITDGGIS